jgi:hypothetical protein
MIIDSLLQETAKNKLVSIVRRWVAWLQYLCGLRRWRSQQNRSAAPML